MNNYWGRHDLNRVCFGLHTADVEHNLTERQQQQMDKEYNSNVPCSQAPFYSDTDRLTSDNRLRPREGDQVVPLSHRWTVYGGHQREAKPLPPLPDPEELMLDEAADNEVEFFNSDGQRLLPKSCPKAIYRGGNKGCGQINYAYQEGSLRTDGTGIGSMAFSWPGREDRSTDRGEGANNWTLAPTREDHQQVVSAGGGTLSSKQPDQHQSPRRFSFSTTVPANKPRIPPRIPIARKPAAASGSADMQDKPPQIPPRVPLVPPCPPRSPSPKTLPIYINGVMPATQSFAANPQYVSKALQQSERAPPAAHLSPCIIPVLKDGRQSSATHYILLPPRRPPRTDRRDRLLSEPGRMGNASIWQNR